MIDNEHPDPTYIGYGRLMDRRGFVARGARLGAALSMAAWLASLDEESAAAAASASPQGQAVLLNFGGWMGKNTPSAFKAKYPGASIKQVPLTNIASGSEVPFLKSHRGVYDASLGDLAVVGQGIPAGIVQELDWSKIPNIKNVDKKFRQQYPHGVPSDWGRTGIAYRPDLVKEKITSWADLWRLAPKYSGKITFEAQDRDCLGSALIYKGFSPNSREPSHIEAAKKALIQIKPHLQAIKSNNFGAGLVNGSTYIAMDPDHDFALIHAKNPKIKWVVPEEGLTGYLEGFFAIAGGHHLDVMQEFLNFFLEPKQYADFVNTTGTAYVSSKAAPLIKKSIKNSVSLSNDPAVLKKVKFESYLGEATPLFNKAWEEFLAA